MQHDQRSLYNRRFTQKLRPAHKDVYSFDMLYSTLR
jgi:hypothetical protein